MNSNFKDLHELAKITACICMEKEAAANEVITPYQTQNSNGDKMTIPPAYLKAVRNQKRNQAIQLAAKQAREVLK